MVQKRGKVKHHDLHQEAVFKYTEAWNKKDYKKE